MVSAEQESVAGMLSLGQCVNIQYMCECVVVPSGMNGLHRNPHRDTLRAGDVDTELLYVWCAHRNQFTVVWKYSQQGKWRMM